MVAGLTERISMKPILKLCKPYIAAFVALVVFTYVAVMMSLRLPDYSANIVNKGIILQDLGSIWTDGRMMIVVALIGDRLANYPLDQRYSANSDDIDDAAAFCADGAADGGWWYSESVRKCAKFDVDHRIGSGGAVDYNCYALRCGGSTIQEITAAG